MKASLSKTIASVSLVCLLWGCGNSSQNHRPKDQNAKTDQIDPNDDAQVDQWVHLLCSVKTQSDRLKECFPSRSSSELSKLARTLNQYEQFGKFPFSFTQTRSFQTRYHLKSNETSCLKSRFCQETYE